MLYLRHLNGDIIDLLIEHGAQTHAFCNLGWTPFMLAVQDERVECVRRLLRYGHQILFPTDRAVRYFHDEDATSRPDSLLGLIRETISTRNSVGFDPYDLEEDPMDCMLQLLLEWGYGEIGRQGRYPAPGSGVCLGQVLRVFTQRDEYESTPPQR